MQYQLDISHHSAHALELELGATQAQRVLSVQSIKLSSHHHVLHALQMELSLLMEPHAHAVTQETLF